MSTNVNKTSKPVNQRQIQEQNLRIEKIYTDWANHYLQKTGNGHSIVDLQKDVRSGVLLAEVIQSVSGEVIHGVLSDPAHDGEALDNIAACLNYLAIKGVNVQEIQPQDILEGNLKCILTLFYGLSRLKQRSRSSANGSNQNPASAEQQNYPQSSSNSQFGTSKPRNASVSVLATTPDSPLTNQTSPVSTSNPALNQRGALSLHSQYPLQKQQLPPTPVAQRSNSFTAGSSSRPLSVAQQHLKNQLLNQSNGSPRHLSEITESDYDYGGNVYSCGSEVYQSLTGAQLWSPSKSSSRGTPSKQTGRGSTPLPDTSVVPSYYLRSLSPPPVVEHHHSLQASHFAPKRDRSSSSKGGISRLFGGTKELKRKKQSFSAAASGTVSEGEAAVNSPARSFSSQPKSPLKTALGKAFGPKPQQHQVNLADSSRTKSVGIDISNHGRSVSCTPTVPSPQTEMPSSITQPQRRMPEQTHLPPPPQSGIPQPKSRVSPSRIPASQQSGIPNAAPPSNVKSPAETRRGIPQPASRPKSPSNLMTNSTLTKASKVPSAPASGKIPTPVSRSKSPSSTSVLSSLNNGDKEAARKLKPVPDTPSASSENENPEVGSNIIRPLKSSTNSAPQSGSTQAVQSTKNVAESGKPVASHPQASFKSALPQSGLRPPGSAIGKGSRQVSQIGRLKQGASSTAPKRSMSARTSPTHSSEEKRYVKVEVERIKSPTAETEPTEEEESEDTRSRLDSTNDQDDLCVSEPISTPHMQQTSKLSELIGSNAQTASVGDLDPGVFRPGKNLCGTVTISPSLEGVLSGQVGNTCDLYGYATDSAIYGALSEGDHYGVYGSGGSNGYMSEGAETAVNVGSIGSAAATSAAGRLPVPEEKRVFKDGISAIKDCLQRSEIKLAESDSEGDVDSVTSNISDLVNDLSSDISANITSPLDKSKASNPNSTYVSPASSKPGPNFSTEKQTGHAVQVMPTAGQARSSKKTAIVSPQKPSRKDSKLSEMSDINCDKNEDFNPHSSSESSPSMSNKGSDGRSNATIKRCPPNQKLQPAPQTLESKLIHSQEGSAFTKTNQQKLSGDILSQSQQPLTGQIRGNVFRLSSVSSVVSEEHEDARSDDCQRYSGGSFQNSELMNSNESLTVLHGRNQMQANFPAMNQQVAAPFCTSKRNQSPVKKPGVPQVESDAEWESASMASFRSSSLLIGGQHDKFCFSDTEDITGKREHGQANLRKMLEARNAHMHQPRKPSSGSDALESSFALMDIRNLRERLANPHNIDTQSDYGSTLSSTLSRSRSGKFNNGKERERDNPIDKFSLLTSISPGDHSVMNKQYRQLPLTQDLLNKAAGLQSSVSPSALSTCSGTGSLLVDTTNRYSAMSDYNPRSITCNSSAMNTPVLGMKHSRSGSSTGLFQTSCANSAKASSTISGLPPELTLNPGNPLGDLANLGYNDHFFSGSNMSLNSASSFESSNVDSQNMQETIRRLKNELLLSNEKVSRLTTHIICNAQTVANFEKTLSNLNQKLSNIFPDGSESTANEIENLRNLIEELKVTQKQEVLSSSQKELRDHTPLPRGKGDHVRANSLDAGCFLSESAKEDNGFAETPSFGAALDECDKGFNEDYSRDTDSPVNIGGANDKLGDKKGKKNWLRSTFKIGRKKSGLTATGCALSSASDAEESGSLPPSPYHPPHLAGAPTPLSPFTARNKNLSPGDSSSLPRQKSSGDSIGDKTDGVALKQKLYENEKKLTETKLQYLSSAHQVDQMRDEMSSLKSELDMLRHENEKLATQATTGSRCSPSGSSITSSNCAACRHSSSESCSASDLQHSNSDLCLSVLLDNAMSTTNLQLLASQGQLDSASLKIVRVKLALGNPRDSVEPQTSSYYVGTLGVTPNTQWSMVDNGIAKVFSDYISRIDPNQLGLNANSLKCWSAGKKVVRYFNSELKSDSSTPTNDMIVSPFDFFKNDNNTAATLDTTVTCAPSSITVHLKGQEEDSCDDLVFETCIPKPHLQRYMHQWVEFKKLVFIGPPGTGKSFMASKLCRHFVCDSGNAPNKHETKSINMDLEDISSLRKIVKDILETSSSGDAPDKTVLLIENLHSLGSHLTEALSILSNVKATHPVYTVATMTSQSNQSYPQLQKVFPRWVLFNNHNEPVCGLVGRFLRRKLLEFENRNGGMRNAQLMHVIEWLPKVWLHVNRIIEVYNSSEVTLGPHLFLGCPIDPNLTQTWFNNLWNFSLAPYLVEAIREGLQHYGVKPGTQWEDPLTFIEESYPWNCSTSNCFGVKQVQTPSPSKTCPPLTRIRKEDVGFDKIILRSTVASTVSDQS